MMVSVFGDGMEGGKVLIRDGMTCPFIPVFSQRK